MARRAARARGGAVRAGPRLRLADTETQDRLVDAIRGGSPMGQAAVWAGISERVLYRTLTRGDEADARVEAGGDLDPDDVVCRDLWLRVKEARAQVAVRNVALVQKAAAGGYPVEETTRVYRDENGRQVRETTVRRAPVEWRAALALLERSFPKDFSRAAQQFEVIASGPAAGGGHAAGAPSVQVVAGISSRLAAFTQQAIADETGVEDAELVDDYDDGVQPDDAIAPG